MKNILKIASLLAAAVMLFACEKAGTEETSSLRLVSDKDVIQANGQEVAILKVYYNGKDVTSESIIYDEDDQEVAFEDGAFKTSEVGEYKFYANYGTLSTFNKKEDGNGLLVIRAINLAIPQPVEDPETNNTSFVHRTFLTQYTGTGCGYCPYMIKILKELVADNIIPVKAVLAAVHSYGQGDPAYISYPKVPKVSSWPYLKLDLVQGFSYNNGVDALKSLVDEYSAGTAKAGISVNPVYYSEEYTLVVKVAVKAAADGVYNVGAWLLEDGIYGQQNDPNRVGDESFSTHDNCVRIADSRYKGTFFGYELGSLKKGETAEKTFVMNVELDRNGKPMWKVENLHLAAFVSTRVTEGSKVSYSVCNAVDVPITEPTPFEYAK